jgi:hypothetical protein
MKLSCTIISLAIAVQSTSAFVIPTGKVSSIPGTLGQVAPRFSTPAEEAAAAESVFMPLQDVDDDDDEDEDDEVDIDTVERLGRGAAKVRFSGSH